MKKTTALIILAAALLPLCSCNQEDAPSLSVSTTTGTIGAEGGTLEFSVYANNEWKVSTDGQGWYSVAPLATDGNKTVYVYVDPFTAVGGRSATITITSEALTQTYSFVQTSPVPPTDPAIVPLEEMNNQAREITLQPLGGFDYVVEVKYGSTKAEEGWISVESTSADAIVLSLEKNATDGAREAEVIQKTTDGNTLKSFIIRQDWKNALSGQFLIEEVFFTGHLTESGLPTSMDGDQYLRITNNTDETLYADGMLLMLSESSSNGATTGAYYAYPVLTDAIGVNTVYMIPGSGADVPVKAGESLVVALAAQDFSEGGGFDLSVADFEFWDESTEAYPDTDNPDVPNLESWIVSSWSFTSLHNRGMESYAIAFAPAGMDGKTFVTSYPWEGVKVMDWNGYHFEREITDAYLVPNEWVIDGINCGVSEGLIDLCWNPTIDAGWCGVSETQSDADRYGKSVLRRKDGGKLVDTDNSTNDFEATSTPTLTK